MNASLGYLEILLLFFGLPLAILAIGLRRGLGPRGLLLTAIAAFAVAVFGTAAEAYLQIFGGGPPVPRPTEDAPAAAAASSAGAVLLRTFRGIGPLYLAGGLLGSLVGVLIRYRGRGSGSGRTGSVEIDQDRPEGGDGRRGR